MTTEKHEQMEAPIRQLIGRLVEAVRAKDIDAVMAMYAPDIVSFDIEPPLRYVHQKHWAQTFSSYQGPIDYEVRDLRITAGNEVAFGYSLNRVRGVLKSGRKTDLWLRWTACLRKLDGRWLITHDHVSVPVDFESGKALLDLEP